MKKSKGKSEILRGYRESYLSETVHCCPECGKFCEVSEPKYKKDEIEPYSATLICPDCGNTHISEKDGSWTTESGVPYIPGMTGNSTTLLHRYGDKMPETKEEFDELLELLTDVSNGYRENFCIKDQLNIEFRMNTVLKKGIEKHIDYKMQLILNAASIVQCLNDLGRKKECAEAIKSGFQLCHQVHAVDACTFALLMTEFDMTPANLDEMKNVYTMLRDKDLSEVPGMSEHMFATAEYYNMLSEVADYLDLKEDYDKLLDMMLEAYLRDMKGEMNEVILSRIVECFETNLSDSSRTDKEELAERYVQFTDKYRSVDDYYYYNAMLSRHMIESMKWDDMHGRDDDLDKIIERYKESEDPDERHLYANALFYRYTLEMDNTGDLIEAYNAITANLIDGEQFDDLACVIIKMYLATLKESKNPMYKTEVRNLNNIGISLNMINDWYRDMSSE